MIPKFLAPRFQIFAEAYRYIPNQPPKNLVSKLHFLKEKARESSQRSLKTVNAVQPADSDKNNNYTGIKQVLAPPTASRGYQRSLSQVGLGDG